MDKRIIFEKKMSKGVGLIEAIAGISIVSIFIFSLMLASQLSQRIVGESVRSAQASFLLEEGAEAVKIFRDTSWSSDVGGLAVGTNYFFLITGRHGFPRPTISILTEYLKENSV